METVRSLGAILLTIATLYLGFPALFDCQHINQAIQIKTGWKISQIAAFRYSGYGLTFRASDRVAVMARSMPLFQAVQTETACKHGSCFGSVNMSEHTEQDTSSRRL